MFSQVLSSDVLSASMVFCECPVCVMLLLSFATRIFRFTPPPLQRSNLRQGRNSQRPRCSQTSKRKSKDAELEPDQSGTSRASAVSATGQRTPAERRNEECSPPKPKAAKLGCERFHPETGDRNVARPPCLIADMAMAWGCSRSTVMAWRRPGYLRACLN